MHLVISLTLLTCVVCQSKWGQGRGHFGQVTQKAWGNFRQGSWNQGNRGWRQSGRWTGSGGFHKNRGNKGWGTSYGKRNNKITDHMLTCVGQNGMLSFALTLKEQQNMNGKRWGRKSWGRKKPKITGELQIMAADGFATATLMVVLTELSNIPVNGMCMPEDVGDIIPQRTKKSKYGWNKDLWSSILNKWNDDDDYEDLVFKLGQVTMRAGTTRTILLDDLPLKYLKKYAGHGLALCSTIVQEKDQAMCGDPVAGCCRIGYSDLAAVLP